MYEYRAKCCKVVDGDTFDFDVDLGFHITYRIRVRLKGVDTPELNSTNAAERQHAQEAKAYCEGLLLKDEWCRLETEKDKIGIYGRYTAAVTLPDGRDLGQLLVNTGLEKKSTYTEG